MANNWNELLVGKLTNLNNSRESIEAVSHWCIFYRTRAQAIVETWCKEFENAGEESQISLLYLASDILINSMDKKGCDGFVDGFWQVLPVYLQDIYQNGEQVRMEVASKLVDIWEERCVFKSGHHNLRTHFLGENPPSSSDDGFGPMLPRKRKLEVRFEPGGTAEKVIAAYQAADENHIDEEIIWKPYESSSKRMKEIENDVRNSCLTGSLDDTQSIQLSDELIQEETVLWECTNQLRSNEKTTAAVISQLREAIQQEEHKLDSIRDQLKNAKYGAENSRRIRMELQNISDSSHKIYNQTSTDENTERTQIATKASFNHVSVPRNWNRGG